MGNYNGGIDKKKENKAYQKDDEGFLENVPGTKTKIPDAHTLIIKLQKKPEEEEPEIVYITDPIEEKPDRDAKLNVYKKKTLK